jgi:hypothetical protein
MRSKRVDGLSIRSGPTVSGICKFESDVSAVGGELLGINFARLTVLNIMDSAHDSPNNIVICIV